MAITNYERVGKALELLRDGLRPFIERELSTKYGKYWITEATKGMQNELNWPEGADMPNMDAAILLRIMWDQWNDVFRNTLGFAERSLVSELREVRNKWAHQNTFSTDDAYRALDTSSRLLTSISAPQADEIEKIKMELLRLRFDEQVRTEKRKGTGSLIETTTSANLKPWREVITPHKDVASGRYQQAEFAADLWQVHLGEGTDEYKNPVEFYRRTYLTESLKGLLAGAILRLSGKSGDPVVQLQTNFGGGKTHSMLALYHLFSGINPVELAGIDPVMKAAQATSLPSARRVVLVGNKISPGNPSTKSDGTIVRTLWGELAWQLGGKKAYMRIQADDENATSPGDVLRELFVEYGPCLILIDEWVAYARQLHDQSDLPAGGFETQFSFAQVLTESAKLANNCLLVISLPASDTSGSPHTQASDAEVGGERGRAALDRLRNVVGRLQASWRPATAEEGFEIVRRRLFEPLSSEDQFKCRNSVARAYADLYRSQQAEFPSECRDADYETRIKAAYPIHPEIFDRLYTDWSTLIKFQRTRGVLRLMAAVIHCLWEKDDRNPLIMPANIPIDDPRVQSELMSYLSDNWAPIIEKDVDGPNSLPLRMDGDVPNLGKYSACRRVARTIYMGSAPLTTAAHRGLEDRRVKLGCVMPGETPAVFGDALRRLAGAATYLYQDGQRYWYSTQPTVTKLAEDRSEQLKREPYKIARELETRLRADLVQKGDFNRIHPLPQSGQDVPDDFDARLVVLGIDTPYSKEPGNPAEVAAKAILEFRGNTPRIFQNTLVFLAADKTRLQDLDEAVRKYLAWETILDEKVALNLDPLQVRQAETQKTSADSVVTARIPETYQWLLVPVQSTPQSPIEWQALRIPGQEPLAMRASKKLRNDELLLISFACTRLRMDLDRIPLWRGNHVALKTLAEDFARYIYLPRLKEPSVLLEAVRGGVSMLTWETDGFAYADSYDETKSRYQGLAFNQGVALIDPHSPALLVKSEVARNQVNKEVPPAPTTEGPAVTDTDTNGTGIDIVPPVVMVSTQPKRFHGSVKLDPIRVGKEAGKIAEEVISHLTGLVGANVTVILDIEADVSTGVPDNVVRTVTENSRTLKFTSQGFEKE
jgi:predicted AAA+ superfamily ATPase